MAEKLNLSRRRPAAPELGPDGASPAPDCPALTGVPANPEQSELNLFKLQSGDFRDQEDFMRKLRRETGKALAEGMQVGSGDDEIDEGFLKSQGGVAGIIAA